MYWKIRKNDKEFVTFDFLAHLVNFMVRFVTNQKLDVGRLLIYDNYFLESPLYDGLKHSAKDIIVLGFKNLTITEFQEYFLIGVDDTTKVDGYNLLSICKLINNGNTEVNGYPIFTKIFGRFNQDLKLYYNMYTLGAL